MCADSNIIDCLAELGLFYEASSAVGPVALFLAPWLVWIAFAKPKDGPRRFERASRILVLAYRSSAFVTGLAFAVAAFFVFPGVLFCSVYCFFLMGLPAVGAATSVSLALSH